MKNFLNDVNAVLPVRLKSTRIEQKVLLPIKRNGKTVTLFENKILQLLELLEPEQIIISCGEEQLIDIALKYNCKISFRDEKFIESNYKTTTEESIREVIKDINSKYLMYCPVVVPFHDEVIFKHAIHKFMTLINDDKFDSLATVYTEQKYIWYENNPLNYHPDNRHVQSQLLEPIKVISNGLYLAETKIMNRKGYFLGDSPYLFEVPYQNCIDIDNPIDYEMCKFFNDY